MDYDNVLNKQREIIYKRRRKILIKSVQEPAFLKKYIVSRMNHKVKTLVEYVIADGKKLNKKTVEDIVKRFKEIFGLEGLFDDVIVKKMSSTVETWMELISTNISKDKIIEQLEIFLENAYDFKEDLNGSDFTRRIEQNLLLDSIDINWMNHLDAMDDLRHTANLRSYGQKDPLVEYKNEGFELFHDMLDLIDSDVVSRILRVNAINLNEREYQAVDLNTINSAVENLNNLRATAGFRPQGNLSAKSQRAKAKRKKKKK